MMKKRLHLNISSHQNTEDYKSIRSGRRSAVSRREIDHSRSLMTKYTNIVEQYYVRREALPNPITEDFGIYIRIESFDDCKLPLDSLDTQYFKLCSLKETDTTETAVVFVPEAKRKEFLAKISQYMDFPKNSRKARPRNYNLNRLYC